jgi:UDP-glucose 4-epimerase
VPEMIAALREGLGRRPGLLPVPPKLVGLAFEALGRSEAFARLNGSLVASPAALIGLGWRPPVAATRDGLAALARASAPPAS